MDFEGFRSSQLENHDPKGCRGTAAPREGLEEVACAHVQWLIGRPIHGTHGPGRRARARHGIKRIYPTAGVYGVEGLRNAVAWGLVGEKKLRGTRRGMQ